MSDRLNRRQFSGVIMTAFLIMLVMIGLGASACYSAWGPDRVGARQPRIEKSRMAEVRLGIRAIRVGALFAVRDAQV